MSYTKDMLLMAGVVSAFAPACWAQSQAVSTNKPNVAAKELDTVTVITDSVDNRQSSTAAKIVVSRDELARFGDTSAVDVLKRLPGVTVTGSTAKGLDVRLRGLGNGYTQLLLNGEPVASGFSIETLSPDLIERIEILRVPTADKSTQAIAGTINIVLKQSVRQAQADARLTSSVEKGRPSGAASLQLADKLSKGSWGIGLEYRHEQRSQPFETVRTNYGQSGQIVGQTLTQSESDSAYDTLTLTPRINWKQDAVDSFYGEAVLNYNQLREEWPDQYTQQVGSVPFITSVDAFTHRTFTNFRTRLNWTRKLDEGAQFDTKIGYALSDRSLLVEYNNFDAQRILQLDRDIYGPALDRSWTWNGKYRAPLTGVHALSIGWDGERSSKTESRIQRDTVPLGAFTPWNLDEQFDARINRFALFAQDEWDVQTGWSLYQGLRWEEIGTHVGGNEFSAVQKESHVLSPIVQSVWKLPDTKGDQIRAGLSRTYRAPTTQELSPRRVITAIVNSPTSADVEGNAELRPELAWGLDLAYEHYFGDKSLFSINLYGRQIKDVILKELSQDSDGLWISRPVNEGQAHALGLEIELKSKLKDWISNASDVDLRINAARNRSWIEAVPGPYNRLAQQTPAGLNLGADWHPPSSVWTFGTTLGIVRNSVARTIDNQTQYSSIRRQLEAYALYKIDARSQIRITGINLLHQNQDAFNTYTDTSETYTQSSVTPTYPSVRIALEFKL